MALVRLPLEKGSLRIAPARLPLHMGSFGVASVSLPLDKGRPEWPWEAFRSARIVQSGRGKPAAQRHSFGAASRTSPRDENP